MPSGLGLGVGVELGLGLGLESVRTVGHSGEGQQRCVSHSGRLWLGLAD